MSALYMDGQEIYKFAVSHCVEDLQKVIAKAGLTEDMVDYYILITEDFAGNRTKKKLTSQRTLLTLFHTSIDRGAY